MKISVKQLRRSITESLFGEIDEPKEKKPDSEFGSDHLKSLHYYWVRFKYGRAWVPAMFLGQNFTIIGSEEVFTQDEFDEIGEELVKPLKMRISNENKRT